MSPLCMLIFQPIALSMPFAPAADFPIVWIFAGIILVMTVAMFVTGTIRRQRVF